MAKELAHFKNFAKLKDTSVAFNDITVIAGKPGTGKSYVMKFQYAYNETISSLFNGSYKTQYAMMDSSSSDQRMLSVLNEMLDLDDNIKTAINDSNYVKALEIFELEYEKTKNNEEDGLNGMFFKLLKKFSERQKKSLIASEEEKFYFIFRNILESIFSSISQVSTEFSYASKDFHVTYKKENLNIVELKFEENYENAIFVETPLIIEFEKFLPQERFQTPYHIDSLLGELNKKDFSFTSDETSSFISEFKKSTQKIVNGNISKGAQGFSFESDNGKTYNIVNASSGTKSIGLLQYLVSNKALKKGSVLYWEEPEVHLHPEWQLRMIELFVELMNAGVKIVFSTHSPYMCDYLNAISQKKGFDDRVSFNLFEETNGVVENHILENDEDWNKIQAELLDPLEEIMWEYI